jgi:MATE family multidrug resistance protein
VSVPLAGLVDVGMLGHLSEIRFLAGVALASLVFDYLYWSFGFLRMGTTGTTAQAVGRGDEAEAHRVLYRSLVLAGLIAGTIVVLQVPVRELAFLLLSGGEGVESAGRDYFQARVWDAPATLANFAFLGWFLGREQSGRALVMTLTAALANIVFNYFFIVRLGLAAFGSGLGTACSQYLSLAVAVALFFAEPGRRHAWRWREVLDRDRLLSLVRLNGDILVRTLCLLSAFSLFTNFSAALGTTVLAANSLLMRLLTFAAYAIDGAAFAAESLSGIFRGSGQRDGLRRTARLAFLVGEGFAVVFLLALAVAPRAVLGLLTSHQPVIESALRHAPWLAPFLVIGSLAFIYDGLYLGLTEGHRLRNAMLVSFAVFLPLGLLGMWLRNNDLLWGALAAFMAARFLTLHRAWGSVLTANQEAA